MSDVCPTLDHIINDEQCFENFAGIGSKVYAGLKSDLSEKMVLTDNTYSEPKFKAGKGLFVLDCKEESNNIVGESLGPNKGYKLAMTNVIEVVNKKTSMLARALSNRNLFLIVPDGDEYQIMYDPIRKVRFESGAIKTETGTAATDDRITTLNPTLQPVKYPNLYVEINDIDTLVEGNTETP